MPFDPRALPIGTLRMLSAGAYTVQADDAVLLCDTTAGNITLQLQTVVDRRLHRVNIVKSDISANTVTVTAFAGETIEGGPATFFVLSNPETAVEIVPDGLSSWWVIADALTFIPPGPPPPSGSVVISFPVFDTEAVGTVVAAASPKVANILVDTDDVYAQDWHDLKVREKVPGVSYDIIARPSVGSFRGDVTVEYLLG